MLTRSPQSLHDLTGSQKLIPVVENRVQLAQALDLARVKTIFIRHCNFFEITSLLKHAYHQECAIYANIDYIDGIHPDSAGLHYLAHEFHIAGVISNNPHTLVLARECGLQTIQRIFVMDSTGLEVALRSINVDSVNLLDIAPALTVPYIIPSLLPTLPLPFIASGLVFTLKQASSIIEAGALAVAVSKSELWSG